MTSARVAAGHRLADIAQGSARPVGPRCRASHRALRDRCQPPAGGRFQANTGTPNNQPCAQNTNNTHAMTPTITDVAVAPAVPAG